MTGAWNCNRKSEKGARFYERPINYSALNYSRSCDIDAESPWIGLANVKFKNSGKEGETRRSRLQSVPESNQKAP